MGAQLSAGSGALAPLLRSASQRAGSSPGPGGERVAKGARPEHSPSSEEKEAEVSIAPWKFSSFFRPSSMFGPGRGDLRRIGNAALGVSAPGTRRTLLGTGGSSRDEQKPQGRGRQEERGVGGEASHRELLQMI